MKLIKLYLIIAAAMLAICGNLCAEIIWEKGSEVQGPATAFIYKCNKKEIGRGAYYPRNVDAAIVKGRIDSEYGPGGTIIITTSYTCICNGTEECPVCNKILIKKEGDNNITQNFLYESAELMENHARERMTNGELVGTESFDTIFNYIQVLRNVSWKWDKSSDEMKIEMNVIEMVVGN